MARTGCFRKHWMSKRCMDLDRHAPRHPLSVEEASPAESPPPGRPQPRSRAAAVSMPRSWCSDGGCQGAPVIVGTALSDRRRSSGRATTGHLPAVLRPSRAGGRTRRTGPHDVLPPGVVPDPWAGCSTPAEPGHRAHPDAYEADPEQTPAPMVSARPPPREPARLARGRVRRPDPEQLVHPCPATAQRPAAGSPRDQVAAATSSCRPPAASRLRRTFTDHPAQQPRRVVGEQGVNQARRAEGGQQCWVRRSSPGSPYPPDRGLHHLDAAADCQGPRLGMGRERPRVNRHPGPPHLLERS
jgi:hypothetical protein